MRHLRQELGFCAQCRRRAEVEAVHVPTHHTHHTSGEPVMQRLCRRHATLLGNITPVQFRGLASRPAPASRRRSGGFPGYREPWTPLTLLERDAAGPSERSA